MSKRQAFQLVCLIALGFVPIISSIQYFLWTKTLIPSTPSMPDGISVWESRLSALKRDLPSRGTLGYLADWDIPGGKTSTDQETEYRLTQYTLAPLVISRGDDKDLIIGNISSRPFDDNLADYFQVNIVKDYGFGIYLLEKRTK